MSKKLPAQTYHDIEPDFLRNKLKFKALQEKIDFEKKFPHVKKFLKKKNIEFEKIREHSAKLLGAGALAGTLFLTPFVVKKLSPAQVTDIKVGQEIVQAGSLNSQELLLTNFKNILPSTVKPLTTDQEKRLATLFKDVMGIPAKANLEGEHLNTSYGLIGKEQHLRRYPGDTLSQQGSGSILDAGMAPGLGAWGYFAPSKSKLTPNLIEDEKWYVVVQTLYLPDWSKRLPYLRDWYKYRKVLVVNTENGNAVVGDIADSGPAGFTGKSFGGSPEVMDSLGGPKYTKGAVVLFFVDDPQNKIPLGPVGYKGSHTPLVSKEVFLKVQELRLTVPKKSKWRSRNVPFRAVFKCASCKGAFTGVEKFRKRLHGDPRRHVYYNCAKCKDPDCKEPPLSEDELIKSLAQFINFMSIAHPQLIKPSSKLTASMEIYQGIQEETLIRQNINPKSKPFSFNDYSKYILRSGTNEEKREIAKAFGKELYIHNKEICGAPIK